MGKKSVLPNNGYLNNIFLLKYVSYIIIFYT